MGIFSKNSIDTEALDKLAIAIVNNSIEASASARKFMSFSMNDELQKRQISNVDFVILYFLLHISSREYKSMFGHARNREFMNVLFPRVIQLAFNSISSIIDYSEYSKNNTDSNEYSIKLTELLTNSKNRFDEYDSTYSKCKDIRTSEIDLYSDKSLFIEAGMDIISQTDQKTEPTNLMLITMIILDSLKKVDFPEKLATIGRNL